MEDFTAFEAEYRGFSPVQDDDVIKCAVMRHRISNELHSLMPEELDAVYAFVRLFNIERRVQDLRNHEGTGISNR